MAGPVFSLAARADLDEIWAYTVRHWGEAQAEKYILEIRAPCEALARGEQLGQPIDEIRLGYRKLATGSHFLFFRRTDSGLIDIVRILHQRMDIPGRLSDL